MQVYVATYEHRHGSDIRVFATAELAEAWRVELAREYWLEQRDGDMPADSAAMADEYWNSASDSGSEFFNYDAFPVHGLPVTADF